MYFQHLLTRKGEPLATICEILMERMPNGGHAELKYSLYLLSQLSYGLVLILQKQAEILCKDVEAVILLIRRFPLSKPEVEEFEEHAERGGKKRKKRLTVEDIEAMMGSFQPFNDDLKDALLAPISLYSCTLLEDLPLPQNDIQFHDDFGPLTLNESLQMEKLLKMVSGDVQNKTSSSAVSSEPTAAADVSQKSMEGQMSNLMEINANNGDLRHDLGSDEALQERERRRPTFAMLELNEVDNSQVPALKKKRRRRGIIIDEVTQLNMEQLRAQMDNQEHSMRAHDDLFERESRTPAQDLLKQNPMMFPPYSILYERFDVPEYDEVPLQYEEAIRLEPMERPPDRKIQRTATLVDLNKASFTENSHYMEQQSITLRSEDIEKGRQNTTLTTPVESTTADPSTLLKSDMGIPHIFYEDDQQSSAGTKMSVAAIIKRDTDADTSQSCTTSLQPERNIVAELFANMTLGYPECKVLQESSQERSYCEKISVMQDIRQLKVEQSTSVEVTNSSLVSAHHGKQTTDDLYGLIINFLNLNNVSTVNFSELIQGRSRVYVVKAFTNLLGLLKEQKIVVKQAENFGEIVIRLC